MKSVIPLLLICAGLITGCAHLPRLSPPAGGMADCPRIYVRDAWQFVHIIEATPPGRATSTLMGVVQVVPAARRLHCVLMTLEGLVLFEADCGRQVNILRALPPFDDRGFAQGLIDDIRLIFLAPERASRTAGALADGSPVCRYRLENGDVHDLVQTGGGWELRCYRKGRTLIRTLVAQKAAPRDAGSPMPAHLTLTAPGMLGYDLTLTLVDAQRLPPSTADSKATP